MPDTPSSLPPPRRPAYPVAHTPRKGDPEARWHRLDDHAFEVARLARLFAEPFGGGVWAHYVGHLHDLGKFDKGFQDYLWQCYLAERANKRPPIRGSAPHKQAGALVADAVLNGKLKRLAQPLYGHHGGMCDPHETINESQGKQNKAKNSLDEQRARARSLHPDLDPAPPGPEDVAALQKLPHARSDTALEMFFRFVFSCLTDADALDTEAHLNPEEAARRKAAAETVPTITTLRDRLIEHQKKLVSEAKPTKVNSVRRAVYEDCRRAAVAYTPGRVFTLTVPTGGGKTRSSLAFALEHAAAHQEKYGLRRIVYAIPFTSIVDQTARDFDEVFEGMPGAVLEHHSAIEAEENPDEARRSFEDWRRLAAQNWDAPLVVTTTVQLFESLLGSRPSRCRKLHRLAKSVIVLDEVQTLPPDLLDPLLDVLRLLTENFGATVVLCTATQPALTAADVPNPFLKGLDPSPVEIVREPTAHFEALDRVTYRIVARETPWDWPRVAAEMRAPGGGGSALCIVNTRRQALDLLTALDPGAKDPDVLHLSTLMCGLHRRRVLEEVRKRLKAGTPTLLASTQLVEAGVHLDFPRVLRALGPLPSIIQAAGRCNREGGRKKEDSKVIVFTPADDRLPPDLYRIARQRTVLFLEELARKGVLNPNFDDPSLVTDWYAQYYGELQQQVDKYNVQRDRAQYRYRTVADSVKIVRDDTVAALVLKYEPDEANAILDEAERMGRMTDALWRRAQPLLVNVYTRDAERWDLEERYPGLYLWPGIYDERTGLAALVQDPGTGFAYDPSFQIC
jgi:CRISPR-associated endonuclease/helicase Cas3